MLLGIQFRREDGRHDLAWQIASLRELTRCGTYWKIVLFYSKRAGIWQPLKGLSQQLRTRGRYVSPHSRSAMPSACCEDTGVSLCRASIHSGRVFSGTPPSSSREAGFRLIRSSMAGPRPQVGPSAGHSNAPTRIELTRRLVGLEQSSIQVTYPVLDDDLLKPLHESGGCILGACGRVAPVGLRQEAGERPHRQQGDDGGNGMMIVVGEGVIARQHIEGSILDSPARPSHLPSLAGRKDGDGDRRHHPQLLTFVLPGGRRIAEFTVNDVELPL